MSARKEPEESSGKRSGPAWLGKRKAAAKTKSDPDWRKHRAKDAGADFKYRFKRTALWLGCLALFAAFIFYLIPPKNTPLVVFRASRYALQLPPLSLAAEDEYFLKHVSPANLPLRESLSFGNLSEEEGSPQRFLSRLKQVKPSGPGWFSRNDLVVIYIAAHGLVNEAGQPCLVPPSADAFETNRWLPLVKLLKDISALPNLKRSRKLVVLDCNRISIKWRSGVMDNRFADQLPAVVDEVNDPNLYVLNSTSPGQVAWAAPELKGTVFGHFLGLALRGDASREFPRDRSRGVVSLLELHAYLTARVDDYVQQRRGARQTPLLIGGADGLPVTRDVPIVSADFWNSWRKQEEHKSPYDVLGKAKELIEPADQQPSSLQLAWQAYQQRAAGHDDDSKTPLPLPWRRGFVLDPIRWASIEQRLLALEDRLFAGEEYQAGLDRDFDTLADELAPGNWQEFSESQTAVNLRQRSWKRFAVLAADPALAGDTPTDHSVLYETWLKAKPEDQPRITFPDADRPQAVGELLSRFGLSDPLAADQAHEAFNRDRLNSVLRFLRLSKDSPPTTELLPVEAHFLKLLSLNTSAAAERQLPDAIRSRMLAEQAATPLDVRAHYALELLVNQADVERRAAEDAFFLGDQVSLDGTGSATADESSIQRSAERRWLRANGGMTRKFWDSENTGYSAARQWGDELQQMYLLRDEIWAALPHLAEWYFRRWRLELGGAEESQRQKAAEEFQTHLATLTELLDDNVSFAEQLERVLQKREAEAELRNELHSAHESFLALSDKWKTLRQLMTADSESRGKSEIRFQTADAVRRIEQVMQTPLYQDARVKGLLAKYHNTLSAWAENGPPPKPTSPASPPAGTDATSAAQKETAFLAGYRKFLVRYHKVLTHEFKLPYEQHRETLKLEQEDSLAIDRRLREQRTKDRTFWQTLQNVLSDYDSALEGKPVDVGPTSPAMQARRELSIWDRRVRTSAFWLGGFNQHLVPEPIGIPSPTTWLREVDQWHLSCWHGYRLLQDFWGNGLAYDRGAQYFELAAQQCAKAAASKQLPFQYGPPGGKIEHLNELLSARVTAHHSGLDLHVPNLQMLDPPQAGPLQFEAKTTQRIESVDRKPASFPAGDAGFYISRAGKPEPLDDTLISYADGKALQRYPVQLTERLRDQPAPRSIACFLEASKLGPTSLEGHVWYRGHLWSQPFELYHSAPAKGIRFVHRREPYSAPTVEVGGDDAAAGAVMFVFDCSSSMTSGDGRFAAAHDALKEILADLKGAPPGGLQIGLIAYGHRTAHRAGYFPAPNEKMFYDPSKLWDDPGNLTPDGEKEQRALGGQKFQQLYPHPDRDIQTLLAPGPGWAAAIDAQLDSLNVNRCFGVTPLYAAIAQAIQEVNAVKGVGSRQVIVLSDGVNIPNNVDLSRDMILVNGVKQNNRDLNSLTSLHKRYSKTNVRVVLFGGVKAGLETEQLKALRGVGAEPEFVVNAVPNPRAIKRAIADAFVKPDFEVAAADRDRPPLGRLQFSETWTYPDWPQTGDLLQPQPHQVLVRGPRLTEPLAQSISLAGGEALRLEYDAAAAALLFVADVLDPFDQAELEPFGSIAPPARPIVIEAVKPLVGPQVGETRPTTFRLRMRSKSSTQFVAWPRYVWAEVRPQNPDPKYKDLAFQISDVKFDDRTRTPVLQFPIPSWPIAVEGAAIDVWVRYGSPPPLFPTVNISPADAELPAIEGSKHGLDGVQFTIRQQLVDGATRRVVITERHRDDTPLPRLYRTRVQLSPPADMIERLYVPASNMSPKSEVIHTFHYTTPNHLAANLALEVNSAEQIKDGSLKASLEISNWNR